MRRSITSGPTARSTTSMSARTRRISSATPRPSGSNVTTDSKQYSWPLALTYDFKANPDGSYQQFSQIHQGFTKSVLVKLNGTPTYLQFVFGCGCAHRHAAGGCVRHMPPTQGQASSETYQYSNSLGACWNETIHASAGNLTSVQGGSCQHRNAEESRLCQELGCQPGARVSGFLQVAAGLYFADCVELRQQVVDARLKNIANRADAEHLAVVIHDRHVTVVPFQHHSQALRPGWSPR